MIQKVKTDMYSQEHINMNNIN